MRDQAGERAVDGSSYFIRSGPRIVRRVDILTELFHPVRLPAPEAGEAVA